MVILRGYTEHWSSVFITLICLVLVFGSSLSLYAQPLFPPRISEQSSNITQPQSSGSEQTGNITDLVAAEQWLLQALKALSSGNLNDLERYLTSSQDQFQSIIRVSPEPASGQGGETETIATGGNYLVEAIRALSTGDSVSLNRNLDLSLQQFGLVLGVPPQSLSLEPPAQGAGEVEVTEQIAASEYSANQLLAAAGAHLSKAIRALETENSNAANENLIISEQQLFAADNATSPQNR